MLNFLVGSIAYLIMISGTLCIAFSAFNKKFSQGMNDIVFKVSIFNVFTLFVIYAFTTVVILGG